MLSDIAIARAARLKPIAEIASKIEIPEDALYPYGRSIAKIEGRVSFRARAWPERRLAQADDRFSAHAA